MGSRGRETAGAQVSTGAPWLPELLESLEDFGTASLELIAWELSLSQNQLLGAKRQAIMEGLIEPVGRDRLSHERTYRIAGRRRFPV